MLSLLSHGTGVRYEHFSIIVCHFAMILPRQNRLARWRRSERIANDRSELALQVKRLQDLLDGMARPPSERAADAVVDAKETDVVAALTRLCISSPGVTTNDSSDGLVADARAHLHDPLAAEMFGTVSSAEKVRVARLDEDELLQLLPPYMLLRPLLAHAEGPTSFGIGLDMLYSPDGFARLHRMFDRGTSEDEEKPDPGELAEMHAFIAMELLVRPVQLVGNSSECLVGAESGGHDHLNDMD